MDIYAPREKEIDSQSIGERGGKSKDYFFAFKIVYDIFPLLRCSLSVKILIAPWSCHN